MDNLKQIQSKPKAWVTKLDYVSKSHPPNDRSTTMATFLGDTALASALLHADGTVATNPGVQIPSGGFVVGLGNAYGLQLDPGTYDLETVASWVKLAKTRTGWLGSWVDPETGTLYLDVVEIESERATAERKASERGELAYYDLGRGEAISL